MAGDGSLRSNAFLRYWRAGAVCGLGSYITVFSSYRQLMTPDHLQARTNTSLRSFNRAVAMVAAPIAGMLADTWGNELMLGVAAVIFALVTVGLGVTAFRRVRAPA